MSKKTITPELLHQALLEVADNIEKECMAFIKDEAEKLENAPMELSLPRHYGDVKAYTYCHVYTYRGYVFVYDRDCNVNMIHPAYYEVGKFTDSEMAIQGYKIFLAGIIDYYDFKNRDLEKFPIRDSEVSEIKDGFTDKDIDTYFPEVSDAIWRPWDVLK